MNDKRKSLGACAVCGLPLDAHHNFVFQPDGDKAHLAKLTTLNDEELEEKLVEMAAKILAARNGINGGHPHLWVGDAHEIISSLAPIISAKIAEGEQRKWLNK